MKKFDLETHFINIPPEPNLSVTGQLKTFFKERRITYAKIIDVLRCPSQQMTLWFTRGKHINAKWMPEFNKLRKRFLKWEELHGFVFNSEEHISAYKQDPESHRKEPPKPKPPTLKVPKSSIPKWLANNPHLIKNTPHHDCPYIKDGVNFGLDYNEYDVCDDCFLSVACYKYKMKLEYS
jgi:hypothetical protein